MRGLPGHPGAVPDVQVIAHRGSSGTYPEHTLQPFEAAIAEGADALECDVRRRVDPGAGRPARTGLRLVGSHRRLAGLTARTPTWARPGGY